MNTGASAASGPTSRSDSARAWDEVFIAAGDALSELATGLSPTDLTQIVPATPAWTVHDVYRHLAGVGTSVLSGAMEGAPGPAWTAAQVAARASTPLTELVAELRASEPALAPRFAGSARPAAVWDRVVHLADLHETLGMPSPGEPLWRPVLEAMVDERFADLPITLMVGDRQVGAGGPQVRVSEYEVFRILFSRRSTRQVRDALGSAPSDSQLDDIPLFGSREDDQPLPGV